MDPNKKFTITGEQIERELREWWSSCQDSGAGPERVKIVIRAFQDLGLLDQTEAAGWVAMVDTCPEGGKRKEHMGGRSWCAYCGDVNPEKTCTNCQGDGCPVCDGRGKVLDLE